jgi:hypothetical protein
MCVCVHVWRVHRFSMGKGPRIQVSRTLIVYIVCRTNTHMIYVNIFSICLYTHICIQYTAQIIHIYVNICVYIYMKYEHIHVCTHIVCACTYIYIYITYIYMYICVCVYLHEI